MSKKHFHVHRGDLVEVVSGNHAGSTGKVLQILTKKDRVIVEGVRMIKKTVRKSQEYPNGAIVEREGPIHISNVKVLEKSGEDKKGSKGTKAA